MYDGYCYSLENSRKLERVHSIKESEEPQGYIDSPWKFYICMYSIQRRLQASLNAVMFVTAFNVLFVFLNCLTQEDRRGENTEYMNIKPQS